LTTSPTLLGRSSSHYTRLARIFAHEAGVNYRFEPIVDMTAGEARAYGDNPALKMPVLLVGGEPVLGAENICRWFAEHAIRPLEVVWPHDLEPLALRNAQELTWHAMQAQVQLVMGVQVAGLDPGNVYFAKAAAGLAGALGWLDAKLEDLLAMLPPRDISVLEAGLFCLVEHLRFRGGPPGICPRLERFAETFGRRESALATPYRFDAG
jgi:glutathione S-transferase